MLKNSYKILFTFTLIISTIISISSSSWFSVWMGLEINLLSFIPIIMKSSNIYSSEASLKYFLTQTLASSTLLFTIIFFSFILENKMFNDLFFINLIFSFSLMMKSGVAPFHFWFPNVMEGLSWLNNLILMTWQKIAPLMILSFCLNYYLIIFCSLLSTFFGSFGGLNQISLRKLMAYSSINHLGWMLFSMLLNETLWKIYFFFYCFLSFSIIYSFLKTKLFFINQIFNILNLKQMNKLFFFIPLLSLGGLPPLLGFFPKWLIIDLMVNFNFMLMLILILYFSLITLFFYIRICYSTFIMNHNKQSWNFFFNKNLKSLNFIFYLIIFFSLMGLMLINLNFFF